MDETIVREGMRMRKDGRFGDVALERLEAKDLTQKTQRKAEGH
jgi:hypothetical protein